MSSKTIILITGPTASGKTDLAIETALKFRTEIVSADSRQIYREMSVGVARPSEEQLSAVKHHFIASVSIKDTYNAGCYARDARMVINDLFNRYDTVVVCGGTGLYIKALFKGLDPLPGKNESLRAELEMTFQTEGISALQQRLKTTDPERYSTIDKNNPQRLIRAIEIALSAPVETSSLPPFEHLFKTETLFLNPERSILYERINKRVDTMLEHGLEQEARMLYPHKDLNALQTVGYSEWWPYIEQQGTIENTISKIKQHTRNYAKRQVTWFTHQSPFDRD